MLNTIGEGYALFQRIYIHFFEIVCLGDKRNYDPAIRQKNEPS